MNERKSESMMSRSVNTGPTIDFISKESRWRTSLPHKLARERPGPLLQLLAIVELEREGISQAELQRRMKVNQSWLSKFLTKLVALRMVRGDSDWHDKRLHLFKPTQRGKDLLRFIEPTLTEEMLGAIASGTDL